MTGAPAVPGGRIPRTYALLGDPVTHSLSPRLYGAAFEALGVDAVYMALRTLAAELETLLQAFARAGGGNVTVPHKIAAARAVEVSTGAVRRTGACNCFWMEEGRLYGDNTDVAGFLGALRAWDGVPPVAGARVLLLGAGGAARAVAAGAVTAGARAVDVHNRTRHRARELVKRVAGEGTRFRVVEGPRPGTRYDLVVNATSLGLEPGDPLPLDPEAVDAGAIFDLVYEAGGTAWVRRARDLGLPARDGLGMLVHQAAASIRRWLGTEPPMEVMERAALEALEGPAGAGREASDAASPPRRRR